ncbi:hypothetical protein RUND412_002591 [Rhizina undulata]
MTSQPSTPHQPPSPSPMDSVAQVPESEPPKQAITTSIQQTVLKNPDWSYAHLKMIYDQHSRTAPSYHPDIITWRTTLTAALTQFLGITGSAIQVDILHLERDEAWLRVPLRDLINFTTATSGFVGASEDGCVGFQTLGAGKFLMGLVGRATEEDIWS